MREQLLAEGREQGRHATFAELRRNGALKKSHPLATGETTKAPDKSSAPPIDLPTLRRLDRAIARSGRTLDEKAYGRLERAFAEETPDDADAWLAEYLGGFGVAPVATTTATTPPPGGAQTAPQTPPNGKPVSDRGAPSAPRTSIEDADLASLSPSDVKALIEKIGLPAYVQRYGKALSATVRAGKFLR